MSNVINNDNTKYFVKNEASKYLDSPKYSGYTGFGAKFTKENVGSLETVGAVKYSNDSKSVFFEGKYSTPKGKLNTVFESRTRFIVDKPHGENEYSYNMTQRFAAKYSNKITDKVGIYEIAGVNSKISLEGDGVKSVSPTSITGVDVSLSKKLSMYTELELSKSYDLKNKNWNDLNTGVYLGVKYTF